MLGEQRTGLARRGERPCARLLQLEKFYDPDPSRVGRGQLLFWAGRQKSLFCHFCRLFVQKTIRLRKTKFLQSDF